MKLPMILTGALIAMQQPVAPFEQPTLDIKSDKSIQLPSIRHDAFRPGERLEYDISYGWVDAGEAIIEIQEKPQTIAGREVLHVIGTGNSLGAFNWFFKVRDRYETYMDAEGVFPWAFARDIHEGGFELQQHYTFRQHEEKVVTDKGEEYEVPLGVQDMISSFYRARAIDFSSAKPGDIFEIQAFVDKELWPLKIKFLKRERMEVDMGTYDCMVFVPVVQTGRIFKEEEDMMVWVSDDKNKIPILAKANILVGSIKMEIRDADGLNHPLKRL